MARSTVATFIERTRRQLDSGHRLEYNALNGDLDAVQTTITLLVEPATEIRFGDILAVELELMRVLTYNASSKQCTVRRGYLDTDGAAHDTGTEVVINPRFSTWDIYEALVDEVNSWGPQLFRVVAEELAVDAGSETIELPATFADMYHLLSVRRQWDGPYRDIQNWPEVPVRVLRSTTSWSDATASGVRIRLLEGTAAGTLVLNVAMPFTMSGVGLTDDLVDDAGIPESYFDFLSMGVKLRLVQDGEWARHARDQQDDARRSAETPVGSAVQPLNFGYLTYTRRKQEEINKLRAAWPMRVG